MADLKPCPFCGGEPRDKHESGWSWIECGDCGAQGPVERLGHGGNHDGAWNKRTMTDELLKPEVDVGLLVAENKRLHMRGLELAKTLSACITAMNPSDRGGISLHEWNQRLKAATKQACAVFDDTTALPEETP